MKFGRLRNRGFTLVEIVIVVAIIAVLATIVLMAVNQARAKSRDGARVSDLKQIELALALYREQSGSYPAQLSSLSPTFLPVVPTDPRTKASYSYNVDGGGLFLVTATLETGPISTCYVKARERTAPTGTSTAACDNI